MTRLALATLALATLVSACAPATTAATPAPTTRATPLQTASSAPTSTVTATAAAAPYLRRELVDVRTNEKFTLASLVGKVVIVEGMAVW